MAASAKELDYDDLISQNILIKRDDNSKDAPTVEVLTKPGEKIVPEVQLTKEQEMYQMEQHLNGLFTTVLREEKWVEETQSSPSEDSDYEVVPVHRSRSPRSELEFESSEDSDWELKRKPKQVRISVECDECGKKCASKRGLLVHKRSHERARNRDLQPLITDD